MFSYVMACMVFTLFENIIVFKNFSEAVWPTKIIELFRVTDGHS